MLKDFSYCIKFLNLEVARENSSLRPENVRSRKRKNWLISISRCKKNPYALKDIKKKKDLWLRGMQDFRNPCNMLI